MPYNQNTRSITRQYVMLKEDRELERVGGGSSVSHSSIPVDREEFTEMQLAGVLGTKCQ